MLCFYNYEICDTNFIDPIPACAGMTGGREYMCRRGKGMSREKVFSIKKATLRTGLRVEILAAELQ